MALVSQREGERYMLVRVLFVCMGNICPLPAVVYKKSGSTSPAPRSLPPG